MECAFCKIYNQKLPAKIIYQDNILSCFLPRNMRCTGICLSSPISILKIKFTKKISLHLKECLGATGINILHASGKSAQQSVPHFHIHIFPRFDNDSLDTWPKLEKKEYDKDEILTKIKF